MVVQHNIAAMMMSRQLGIAAKASSKRMERLGSGYRINRAADDAASLAISEKMRAQIRGLQKGSQNVQEGISFCNVAEGALNEVHDILSRVKELAVQAASDTYVLEDREAIEAEFKQLKEEINRISKTTEFNSMRIFDDGEFKIEFSDEICPIKIFNATHGDPGDPNTYGGIIISDDVRVAWKDIDQNMVYTDPDTGDVYFKAGEYKYETEGYNFTITCEDGTQPPKIKVEFEVSAGGNGITIAGSTIRWEDVINEDGESILDHIGEEGWYHFRDREGEGGFYVEEGATLADIIEGLNNYNEKTNKRYYNVYDGYYTEQAVTVADCGTKVQITQDTYDNYIKINADVDVGFTIKADEDAIWTVDKDGNELADSRKTWAELGLEHWSSTNDVSDMKTYKYEYHSADGGVNVEFSMFLLDETSKQSVIEGINEMELQEGRYYTNNVTTLTVDTSGNVSSGTVTSSNNLLSLHEEAAFGRNFDQKTEVFASSTIVNYAPDTNTLFTEFTDGNGDVLRYDVISATTMETIRAAAEGLPTQYLVARAVQSLMNGSNTIKHDTVEDVVGSGSITTTGFMTETLDTSTITVKTGDLGNGSYPTATIDFSALGTSYQLYDLLGTGFDSTCMTCNNHYSVMFTYGTAENTTSNGYGYSMTRDSGSNYTMNIDLKTMMELGIDDGAEFSKALVEVLAEGNFDFHFTQYAADDSGKFYICDNRSTYLGTNQIYDGSFYVEPYQAGQVAIDMKFKSDTDSRNFDAEYTYNIFDKLAIEAVAEQDDANGKYIINASGQWELYDASDYYDSSGNLLAGVIAPTRYNIKIENRNDTLDWEKIYDDIMTDLVSSSTYSFEATDYAFFDCAVQENPNEAYVSTFRFQTEEEEEEGMWIQAGPNKYQGLFLNWEGFSSHYLGISYLSMTDREEASTLIRRADKAIEKISGIRSAFGAYTNRLEKIYDMNQNYKENLQMAESKIRDADMAKEVLENMKWNVLQQAAQSLLAQNAQQAESVLNLLQ